jgi:TonB family protein
MIKITRSRTALAGSLVFHLGLAAALFISFHRNTVQVRIESIEVISFEGNSSSHVAAAGAPTSHAHTELTQAPNSDETSHPVQALPPSGADSASTTSQAKTAGSGKAVGASALNAYLGGVREKLSAALRAPRLRSGMPLRAVLKLTLLETGEVAEPSIEQPSGSTEFDRAVLEALDRAKPFPHFTTEMTTLHQLTLRLPIEIRRIPRRHSAPEEANPAHLIFTRGLPKRSVKQGGFRPCLDLCLPLWRS